jgi:hypothetical protein
MRDLRVVSYIGPQIVAVVGDARVELRSLMPLDHQVPNVSSKRELGLELTHPLLDPTTMATQEIVIIEVDYDDVVLIDRTDVQPPVGGPLVNVNREAPATPLGCDGGAPGGDLISDA